MISTRARLPLLLLAGLLGAAPLPLLADDGGDPAPVRAALARARESRRPEAGAHLRAAADSAPVIADWLLLRAAALSEDSLERSDLYTRIQLPVVRARIGLTEATARERDGDLAGAARTFDSLGLFTDATRLRLRQARTDAQRRGLRDGLLSLARQRAGTPAAQEALKFLASPTVVLTPQEALEVARLAGRSGLPLEAALLYSRAVRRGPAEPADLLAYARALASLRRHREAITTFHRIPVTSPLSADALYGEAASRARLGERTAARAALTRLLQRVPDDSVLTPRALFLRGSLAWDDGAHRDAREPWLALVTRYPHADSVGRAGFLAALALYEEGRIDQAGEEWSRIHQLDTGADGLAAGYWAARALHEAGDTSGATLLWQSVMARDSVSYYAYASAARLGRPGWQPAAAPDRFTHFLDVDSAMSRIGLLKAAGMVEEASWERAWLTAERVRSPQRLLSVADAFRRLGDPDASIASARAALARGAPRDARTYRLLYPRHYEDNLAAEARAIGVDPLVVAALIRQESAWNAGARSRVGARGLMQVMPATGRLIARQLGVRGWRVDHLDEPALNLRFGTFYLGQVLQRFNGDLVRALAAYNAGPGRVPLWSVGRAADDPEMFVERIGFKETRDYVRTIQRNVALYRALYPAAPAT
ncbi:MAG: lytic transglycosylase domain-containing protein [Gemmatimonadetes bacterium]|nr:lytic transglycosylase domain-containing protein [Gemmatimonadota bacterium]MBK9069249.1 lytic transglycosylase domain-containing protein [Gemmatimonadota bacterium]